VPAKRALFKISYEDNYNLPMNKEFLSKEKIKQILCPFPYFHPPGGIAVNLKI
jgi:hypothetical protein